MLKVITVTNDKNKTKGLIKTLERTGFNYVVIETEWLGFGTKIIETAKFLKCNPGIEQFIFADAHDVLCFGTPNEFKLKLNKAKGTNHAVFSAEKNCWPDANFAFKYNQTFDRVGYLNGGLFWSESEFFIKMIQENTPPYNIDDQFYYTTQLLYDRKGYIGLDFDQELFQSYSFIGDKEYDYSGDRPKNNISGTFPVLFHGNGRTDMSELYKMLL